MSRVQFVVFFWQNQSGAPAEEFTAYPKAERPSQQNFLQ